MIDRESKTLLQIEKEINEFLCSEDFLNFKEGLKDAKGLTRDRAEMFIKYFDSHVQNNIDKSLSINNPMCFGFFEKDRYVPIQTKYTLPNGEIEYCNIGTLFACSTERDVMNMRLWAKTTSIYVRFKEEYLYKDTYNLCSSSTYKLFDLADVHRNIIAKRKDEIIKEIKGNIKNTQKQINRSIQHKKDLEDKLSMTEKWRV